MESLPNGDRPVVSIMTACQMLNVSRRTLYNYIAHGCVDYVRSAGGALRIFVDTLDGAKSRMRETRKQERLARAAKPPASIASNARRSPEVPASPPAREPLFLWSGRPLLFRNMGRPVGTHCPCCATRLIGENLYDSLEPDYESEENLWCAICGWSCHYQCRPLTRGPGSQFYIVPTLRVFRRPRPIAPVKAMVRRLNEVSTDGSVNERVETAARALGDRAFHVLAGHDTSEVLLAVAQGKEYIAFHCRQVPTHGSVSVEEVSLLRAMCIDWDARELRMSLRTLPIEKGVSESESRSRELGASFVTGLPFLQFLGVCSPNPFDLETMTESQREELVAERDRNRYRYRRPYLDLMAALQET